MIRNVGLKRERTNEKLTRFPTTNRVEYRLFRENRRDLVRGP